MRQLRGHDRDAIYDWGEALWTAPDVLRDAQKILWPPVTLRGGDSVKLTYTVEGI